MKGHFGWNFAKDISALVSRPSEENLDLEKLSSCSDSENLPVLAAITKEYRALLKENNALDFSLIQTMMWELLKDEYVLNDLREKIQYLMIDEYQDTNSIQEQILSTRTHHQSLVKSRRPRLRLLHGQRHNAGSRNETWQTLYRRGHKSWCSADHNKTALESVGRIKKVTRIGFC